VRRIPALLDHSVPDKAKAPEYGALQTLRDTRRLRTVAQR